MKQGKTIYFKLVEESDAEFILLLRNNEKLNKYLSKTDSNLANQKQWIREYKQREQKKTEFYFIICRIDTGEHIGTVRLYDFLNEKKSFCWGSWILTETKTRSAAIESALLVYDFAFNDLDFENCHFDVRKDNHSVIKFHKKFGATEVNENNLDYFYEYSKSDFCTFFEKNKKFLEK